MMSDTTTIPTGKEGDEPQAGVPVDLQSPSHEEPKELSPSELLMELDKRGFTSAAEATGLIRRYDHAVAEYNMKISELEKKQKECEEAVAHMEYRENLIKEKADALFNQEKQLDDRLQQINDKLKLLTKLES